MFVSINLNLLSSHIENVLNMSIHVKKNDPI